MAIVCSSVITHVNVHARGALVTRRVALPDALPEGDVAVSLEGITALAESSSVQAALPDGCGRAAVAVRATPVVPAEGKVTGASVDRVRALRGELARVQDERAMLAEHRGQLANVTLDPGLRPRQRPGGERDVSARVADALAADAMLSSLLADLDARAIALDVRARELAESLAAEELRDAQARASERVGAGHPTLTVTVHLTGTGAPAWLDVTYAVAAARWWPVYTLRLRDQARHATWLAEALVAQRSGEDWTGVRLALSTADLLFDARLPELPSLRLGRAQPPPRKGYRAPPKGLDRMFEGHDRSLAGQERLLDPPAPPREDPMALSATLLREEAEGYGDAGYDADEPPKLELAAQELPRGGGGEKGGRARAMAPPQAPAGMAMPMRKSAGVLSNLVGGIADGVAALGGGGSFGAKRDEAEEESAPVEPEGAWLDFDALRVKPARDRAHRGRLVREGDGHARERDRARGEIESAAAPAGARDPLVTRGMFDHRYDVEGLAEVPADALTHRVSIGQGETAPTIRWRTTPREDPQVYREADLRNPFDAPLLGGPVDVYVDGSLLAVAAIDRIDRGGTMRVGMGVEQRIRVARNARVREETVGILGGDAVVTHDVSIELSSALGATALVEVLDRRPVTDDKDIQIELTRSAPEHERYTQSERGSAVRGGLAWRVMVPAGGKATVDFTYRVTLPSKNEIVGGNRRD